MHLALSGKLSAADRELARTSALDSLLSRALDDLGQVRASVNCRLTTPAELRRLNRQFAGQDRVTDVLAFPAAEVSPGGQFLLPPSEAKLLGDVVISVSTAAGQARAVGGEPAAELRLLAIHGLLHLLGHDHGEPRSAGRMTTATRRLLTRNAVGRGEAVSPVPQLLAPE